MAEGVVGVLHRGRPFLRRALPPSFHNVAGRFGRSVVRTLDTFSITGCVPGWHRIGAHEASIRSDVRPRVLVSASLQAGGAERQLVNLMRGLAERGNRRHVLLCFHLGEHADQRFFEAELGRFTLLEVRDALPLGMALTKLIQRWGEVEVGRLRSSLAWAPADLRSQIIRLVVEFSDLRPGVVHGWQDATGLAAAVAGLIVDVPRVIISTRNLNPSHFEYYRHYMAPLYMRLSEEPNVVFTNNSEAGARDYERWLGLEQGRFRVVRNGIDETSLRRLDAQAIRERLSGIGLPPGSLIVGGIFRLQEEKRPLLWLEAARYILDEMPNVQFVLYGGGSLESKVRTMIRKLGLDHHLVMAGKTANPADALSLFDVLMLTSALEGTPNVILEASMLGVPVVATAVGGTAETILPGASGHLVQTTECDSGVASDRELARRVAGAVINVLEGQSLRQSASQEGPAFVRRNFGLKRMIVETEALYECPDPMVGRIEI